MTGPTERRERAGKRLLDGHTHEELAAFVLGCDWQHKTTIAEVVAWLRAENWAPADNLARAIERGQAEGASDG